MSPSQSKEIEMKLLRGIQGGLWISFSIPDCEIQSFVMLVRQSPNGPVRIQNPARKEERQQLKAAMSSW
jgi:hypothetical protein